jgi:hypothetical protein
MNRGKLLITIGLLLGLVGVIIIFIWGPPQLQLEEGIGIGLEDNNPIGENGKTVKQFNEETKNRRRRHNILSRVGLGLIFIGFIFQLWGTWA